MLLHILKQPTSDTTRIIIAIDYLKHHSTVSLYFRLYGVYKVILLFSARANFVIDKSNYTVVVLCFPCALCVYICFACFRGESLEDRQHDYTF